MINTYFSTKYLIVGTKSTGKTLLGQIIAGQACCPVIAVQANYVEETSSQDNCQKLIEQITLLAPCILFIDDINLKNKRFQAAYNQIITVAQDLRETTPVVIIGTCHHTSEEQNITSCGLPQCDKILKLATIFSYEEVVDFLSLKLELVHKTEAVKIPVIARLVRNNRTVTYLTHLIESAQKLSYISRHGVVDMIDFTNVIDNKRIGLEEQPGLYDDTDLYETAIHEAGHALMMARHHHMIIQKATIVSRINNAGYAYTVGHVQPVLINQGVQHAWSQDNYTDLIIQLLAGGIAEQIFAISHQLNLHSAYTSQNFSDYTRRESISTDLDHAQKVAVYLAEIYYENIDYYNQKNNRATRKMIHIKANEIIKNCYAQALERMLSEKNMILRHNSSNKIIFYHEYIYFFL